MELTQAEQDLALRIGFDEVVLKLIKAETGGVLKQFCIERSEGWPEIKQDCKPALYVEPTETEAETEDTIEFYPDEEEYAYLGHIANSRQEKTRQSLQKKLKPFGYLVFLLSSHRGLLVLRTTDQFDALRIVETNGINFGLETSDVVVKLQDWDARYGLEVFLVGFELLALKLHSCPDDLLEFAQEVWDFCPEGIDNYEFFGHQEARDLTNRLFELHAEAHAGQISGDELMTRFLQLQPWAEEQKRLRQRDLEETARHICKTRMLFFWWD
jgi:hypothetical protein